MANTPKSSLDVKFEFLTLDDLKDGGYARHYRINTVVDHEGSNEAAAIRDMKAEFTQPFYKCPNCEGPELFKTINENYVDCRDCNKLVRKDKLVISEKKAAR